MTKSSYFKLLFLVLVTLLPVKLVAADYTDSQGVEYTIVSQEAKVTGYTSSMEGSIIIPAVVTINSMDYTIISIAESAFENAADITDLTFSAESSLTTVEKSAFSGSAIQKITLPATLTSIEEKAFYNASSLWYVSMLNTSSSSITVGTNAFSGIDSGAALEVPYGCTSSYTAEQKSKWSAFSDIYESTKTSDSQGLEYKISSEGASLSGYTSELLAEITIPVSVTVNGVDYPVYEIGASAFSYNTTITIVNVADGSQINTIRGGAFYQSTLQEITIPELVTDIRSYAFYGCSELYKVTMLGQESSDIEVSTDAFKGISSQCALIVPQGCVSNYEADRAEKWYDFDEITDNTDYLINITQDNVTYSVIEKSYAIATGYVNSPTSITIPATVSYGGVAYPVTSISVGAFQSCKTLTSFSFASGSNVETIGASSISYVNIESVEIPASVVTIGNYAFAGCEKLKSVTVESNSKLTTIDQGAFQRSSLESIAIPSSLISIGYNAFNLCASLSTVDFEDGSQLTSIGQYAFAETGLVSINIPQSVQTIMSNAFENSNQLTLVYINSLAPKSLTVGSDAFFGINSPNTLVVPSESISDYQDEATTKWSAFTLITDDPFAMINITENNLSFVVLDKVTTILIGYTGSPTDVVIPATVSYLGETFTVNTINPSAFKSCSTLASVSFESGCEITEVGEYAFSESSITSITIPSSITQLGDSSFYKCKSLTSLKFDDNLSLTTIGESMFENTSIEELVVPTSIDIIGINAFKNCSSLASITFPQGTKVTQICDTAFSATAITSIVIPASVTTLGSQVFNSCSSLKTASFEEGTTVTELPDYAFYNTALETFALPVATTRIGDYAFEDCSNLKNINVAECTSLEYIGFRAFASTGFENITIPASIKTIGSRAFYYASALDSVTILNTNPSTLSVGNYAFYKTKDPTVLTVPTSAIMEYKALVDAGVANAGKNLQWEYFEEVVGDVLVTLSVSSAANGSATLNGGVETLIVEGATPIVYEAFADIDYEFSNWTDASGNIVSTENPYNIEGATIDLSLTANFIESDTRTITSDLTETSDAAYKKVILEKAGTESPIWTIGENKITVEELYVILNKDQDSPQVVIRGEGELYASNMYVDVEMDSRYNRLLALPFDFDISTILVNGAQAEFGVNIKLYIYNGKTRAESSKEGASVSGWEEITSGIISAYQGIAIAVTTNNGLDQEVRFTTANISLKGDDKTIILERNPSTVNGGADGDWNFNGNPQLENMDKGYGYTLYLYNQSSNTYREYSSVSDVVLSPYSAWLVQSGDDFTEITFSVGASVGNSATYINGKVTLTINGTDDDASIYLVDGASDEYVINEDAMYFATTNSTLSQIYFVDDNCVSIAESVIPELSSSINITYKAVTSGAQSIAITTDINNASLYLYDAVTGKEELVIDGLIYEFESEAGTFSDRFKLITKEITFDFGGFSTGIESATSSDVTVLVKSNSIVVVGAEVGSPVSIIAANGAIIYKGYITSERTEIPLQSDGVILVKLDSKVVKVVM